MKANKLVVRMATRVAGSISNDEPDQDREDHDADQSGEKNQPPFTGAQNDLAASRILGRNMDRLFRSSWLVGHGFDAGGRTFAVARRLALLQYG